MPAALLVKSCELFGIRENAARVALTRMVAARELIVVDGRYELVGRLRERQSRQDRSRRGLTPNGAWDGTWLLAVIAGEARSPAERAELRRLLGQHRYAEWREGLWARPDNLRGADATPGDHVTAPGCSVVTGCHPEAPKTLAASLFAVPLWVDRARLLIDDLRDSHRQLRPSDSGALAASFVLSAAVLRHLQADPLLPTELLPSRWPGTRLRTHYESFDQTFQAVWRAHLRGPQ